MCTISWLNHSWLLERKDFIPTSVTKLSDSSEHCKRLLPSSCSELERTRRIVWYNYGDRAGLDDRRQVLWTLSNLAVSLCARVAVPPPLHLLDPERHFTDVSPALAWDDLVRVTDPYNVSVLWEVRQPRREFTSTNYQEYHRVTTRQPTDFYRDYQQLRKHSMEEETVLTPFLWEVKVSWHQVKHGHWPGLEESARKTFQNVSSMEPRGDSTVPAVFVDSTLEPSTPGCLWIRPFGVPDEMKRLVETVWEEIYRYRTPATIGFLHIRRGDSAHRCDTSLATLETYLSCSFGTLPVSQRTIPLIVLLATDDTDAGYRQGVAAIVNGLGLDVELIDLDALVWRHVKLLRSALHTNYYVYAIEWEVKHVHVHFVMERRHSQSCHTCEDLALVLDGPSA